MKADIKEQSVIFRPAKPDLSEGLQFACYLDQAAEGFFRFMLGSESDKIIAAAFIDSNHTLSHENVVFAEIDTKIVGMCSTFTEYQQREFSEEPLLRAAGRNAIRLKIVRTLFAPLWRILETIPEGDFYLQGVAIEPELRGTGIGSILMNDIEHRAKASKSNRISLDVSAKNDGAIRLYKRLGMVDSSMWPSSRFLPTVFVRMSKDL